ncbi:hypothetical protein AUP68_10978 [Ilyonectria robusta]
MSIVFIHGLMGHRTKTWTKNDVLWPDELLPNKIPTARILTFGYDANIVHFWSRPAENRVDVISNSFFSQLTNNRSAVDAVGYEESPELEVEDANKSHSQAGLLSW